MTAISTDAAALADAENCTILRTRCDHSPRPDWSITSRRRTSVKQSKAATPRGRMSTFRFVRYRYLSPASTPAAPLDWTSTRAMPRSTSSRGRAQRLLGYTRRVDDGRISYSPPPCGGIRTSTMATKRFSYLGITNKLMLDWLGLDRKAEVGIHMDQEEVDAEIASGSSLHTASTVSTLSKEFGSVPRVSSVTDSDLINRRKRLER